MIWHINISRISQIERIMAAGEVLPPSSRSVSIIQVMTGILPMQTQIILRRIS